MAADAQNDFLEQALLQVAGVELLGDIPDPGRVVLDLRIHEKEGDPAHRDLPQGRLEPGVYVRNLDHDLIVVFVVDLIDGGGFAVHRLGLGLLPAVVVHGLLHEPGGIHEAHRNNGHAHVAAFLEVVPGQEAEPARIEGEGVVQAVFRAEIGDGSADVVPGIGLRIEVGHDQVVVPQVVLVPGSPNQGLVRKGLEHAVRVVAAVLPGLTVQHLEEHSGVRVPAPPQVFRKLAQSADTFGNVGKCIVSDFVCAQDYASEKILPADRPSIAENEPPVPSRPLRGLTKGRAE